jgi:predicted house-cleaning NTP pyrophosphatase (Maf/HAM1 superfamily)
MVLSSSDFLHPLFYTEYSKCSESKLLQELQNTKRCQCLLFETHQICLFQDETYQKPINKRRNKSFFSRLSDSDIYLTID